MAPDTVFCDYCAVEPAADMWAGRRIGQQCFEERAVAAVVVALLASNPTNKADEEEWAWLMGDQAGDPPARGFWRTVVGEGSRRSSSEG